MSRQTLAITDALHQYLLNNTLREPAVFRELREETDRLENAEMQIAPEQGQFMGFLVELLGATRAIELGTFTGYSALCIAAALPASGRLICCDTSEEWTSIAQRYWKKAGLGDRIELRLGPALETLDQLLADGEAGTFDFMFLDADKPNNPHYYERALALLRPGGVVAVDNALNGGRVLDPEDPAAPNAGVTDALNRQVCQDERVTMSLVPVGDGVLLARKR